MAKKVSKNARLAQRATYSYKEVMIHKDKVKDFLGN